MGQSTLIMVLGFAVTMGIMGISINRRGSDAVANSVAYYEHTMARNVASSAVEIYIKKLKDNRNLRGSYTINPIMGGRANVTISEWKSGVADTLKLTVVGTYGSQTFQIQNTLSSVPMSPPGLNAAVGITFGTKAHIKLGKNTLVDGNNYDINGNLDTASCAAKAGIYVGQAGGDSVEVDDHTVKIKGKGTVEPNIERGPQTDVTEWVKQLIAMADVVYSNKEVNKEDTLGTLAKPQITYVTGNTKFNKKTTGAGILIVEGNIKTSGDFIFHGLVIAVGDSVAKENVQIEKRSEIIGALMMSGKKTKFHTKGRSQIKYSCEAIKQAFKNLIGKYEITDWWE